MHTTEFRNRLLPTQAAPYLHIDGLLGRCTSVLVLAALWLASRPYLGIVGDSRFYNVQILHYLSPRSYDTDLYFQYGSQDEYSVFTVLLAPVIHALGLNAGNIILNAAVQGLWLSGAWYLVRGLLEDRRIAVLVTALTIILPGGIGYLHNAEPFLTPRPLAEALTLWALGAMLRGNLFRAAMILAASLAIHPLMSLPGLTILFVYSADRHKMLWGVVTLGAAGVIGLALAGIQPMARLTQAFDPEWFSVVIVRDGFCFIRNWDLVEWLPFCNTLAVATVALAFAKPVERRLLVTALAVGLLGVAASFVGGDLLHLVLVSDAQLWRAMWLLSFIANTVFLVSLTEAGRLRGLSLTRPVLIYVLAGFFLASSRFLPNVAILVTPVAVIGLLVHLWEHHRQVPLQAIGRVLVMVLLGVAGALGMFGAYVTFDLFSLTPMKVWWTLGAVILAGFSLLAVWFQSGTLSTAAASPRRYRIRFCLALGLMTSALAIWDQRPPWARFIETETRPPLSLSKLVSGKGDLYWEGDIRVPWLLLRKASYFSCDQGTGALFKKGTAIAYSKRLETFKKLGTLEFQSVWFCASPRNDLLVPLVREDLSDVCTHEAGLGEIVLLRPVQGVSGKVWVSPVDFEETTVINNNTQLVSTKRFYVYSCQDFRQH